VRPRDLIPALVLLTTVVRAAPVGPSVGGEVPRHPSVPRSLSGITCMADGTFLAVADDARKGESGLYRVGISLSDDGEKILSATVSTNDMVRLEGAVDLEAVAWDPLSGRVWAADESKRTIAEYDPETGRRLSLLELPAVMRTARGNLGYESLTISPDGRTLWTCNEEALSVDGCRSSFATGTVVRLLKYVRPDARTHWKLAAMYPYRTEKWRNPRPFGSLCRRGVADLTALPDGSLLVLERDLSFTESFSGELSFAVFRLPRPESATDVTALSSLDGDVAWEPAAKVEVASGHGALVAYGNFEGMCLGPKRTDGRQTVLLVSDAGDGFSRALVLPLVLSDVD